MLETTVKSKCSIYDIINGDAHRVEITKHPDQPLYSIHIYTSPYLTDPAKYFILVNKDSLKTLKESLEEILKEN